MAEIRDDIVVIEDDAGNDSLFGDGGITSGIVPDKAGSKWASQASGFWTRAKAGYEKAQDVHEHGGISGYDEVEADGVELHNIKVGAWERLASIPQTVAGVVGYRTTGTATGSAHASAGLLVKEELVELEVPKPKPIPDLVHNVTDDVSGLVRAEVALVKTEIKQKVKILGPAIALFVVALAMLLFALPFLIWAAVFALGLVLPLWAASLIMFGVLLVLTAVLAFVGLKMFKKLGNVKSLAGGSIKETIHEIVEAFKGHKWADAQKALKEGRL